jgi:hypothetical protein
METEPEERISVSIETREEYRDRLRHQLHRTGSYRQDIEEKIIDLAEEEGLTGIDRASADRLLNRAMVGIHSREPERARARHTDPDTSHAAAKSVGPLTTNQTAVMQVLRLLGRPVTDEDLVSEYQKRYKGLKLPQQSESGIRSRRNELDKRHGKLEQGDKQKISTGRMARTWSPKER